MILLNIENLTDENIKLIEQEKEFLNFNINIHKKKKETILNYMQNFANSLNLIDTNFVNNILETLENLKNTLNLCNENISCIDTCINSLDNIIFSIKNNSQDLNNILTSFNYDYSELNKSIINNTLKIENYLCDISKNSEIKFENSTSETEQSKVSQDPLLTSLPEKDNSNTDNFSQEITTPKIEENQSNQPQSELNEKVDKNHLEDIIPEDYPKKEYKENTLIVSETSGKITLPYNISTIKEIFERHPEKYTSIDSVINKNYTLPISMFKNPIISRFREAFKLIREREHGSVADGFELGLELMFNYNLHPAIISACKTLDELDIYLDYLESGQTNKFNCFKIIFELPPVAVKKKRSDF